MWNKLICHLFGHKISEDLVWTKEDLSVYCNCERCGEVIMIALPRLKDSLTTKLKY